MGGLYGYQAHFYSNTGDLIKGICMANVSKPNGILYFWLAVCFMPLFKIRVKSEYWSTVQGKWQEDRVLTEHFNTNLHAIYHSSTSPPSCPSSLALEQYPNLQLHSASLDQGSSIYHGHTLFIYPCKYADFYMK